MKSVYICKEKLPGGCGSRRGLRMISVFLAMALLLAFSACAPRLRVPALSITGDCEGYTITARGFSLHEAIRKAGPRPAAFDVLLIGKDGLVSRISGEDLSGCSLLYNPENGWEHKSVLHPPSARVKNLAQVAVIGADTSMERLLLQDGLYDLKEEGTSRKNDRSVTVYTTLAFFPADRLTRIDFVSTQALDFLGRDSVMVIELDGLGWEMLLRAGEQYAPYLFSLTPKMALAAYPSNSKTGLAALLGIQDNEDLFSRAAKLGKVCAYVEGSHVPVGSSLRPVMSLADEDVFANTLEALAAEPDLIFVHFHGIDDVAQDHGPYAEQTTQKISEIDAYMQSLVGAFPGRVIITADHGLHVTEEGGAHGTYSYEDMMVPYIVK